MHLTPHSLLHQARLIEGDAIGDIAGIAEDLLEIAWYWDYTSKANALWHFEWGYRNHWGGHLRGLQMYIWHQKNGW